MPATATPDQPIFYVYIHKEADTGRPFYIGKGHGSRAWSIHGRNKWWQRIAKKHGFKVEIMADGLTEPLSFEFEMLAIASVSGLCNFGEGGEGNANPPAHIREKFRQRQLGKSPSIETRRRLSEAMTGKEFTEDHRANISKSAKRRGMNQDIAQRGRDAMSRAVISEVDGKWFKSIRAAADHFVGLTGRPRESIASCISSCVRTGKNRKTCGTTWRYANDGESES